VKSEQTYFHCGEHPRHTLSTEIAEIGSAIGLVEWREEFSLLDDSLNVHHQAAYNRAFQNRFRDLGWESQPLLRQNSRLIGDFRKGLVFVEIQFGTSSALYRDYYKFQYGLANGLLSLAVLIVPTQPDLFFPTRPRSVQNMADYGIARTCLTVLPISVPTLLIGLLPESL
jgi:hypothetical protein